MDCANRRTPPQYRRSGAVNRRYKRWNDKGIRKHILAEIIDDPAMKWLALNGSYCKVKRLCSERCRQKRQRGHPGAVTEAWQASVFAGRGKAFKNNGNQILLQSYYSEMIQPNPDRTYGRVSFKRCLPRAFKRFGALTKKALHVDFFL